MKVSIRLKIFLGFFLVLILSFISQVASFLFTENIIYTEAINTLNDKASMGSTEISSFINKIELEHLNIAHFYQQSNSLANESPLEQYLTLRLKQDPYLSQLTIISSAGREMIKVNRSGKAPSDDLNFEIRSTAFEKARTGSTGLSKVFFDEDNQHANVYVFTPIISPESTISAVIKAEITLDSVWNLLSQIKLGSKGFTYVVDDEGRLIAHPDSKFLARAPLLTTRPLVKKLLADLPLSSVDHVYQNETNAFVVGSGQKLPGLGWLVLSEQPVTEAFANRDLLRNLFFGTLGISLIFLVVFSYLVSRQLTKPILQLQQFAHTVQLNQTQTPPLVLSGDEIESLSRTFNVMVQRLNAAFSSLKSKVDLLEKQKQSLDLSTQKLIEGEEQLREINQALANEKQTAEAERNQMAVILAGITDAVIVTDKARQVILFNGAAEKLTGLKTKEVLGHRIEEIITVSDKEGVIPEDDYCPPVKPGFEGVVYHKQDLKMTSAIKKNATVDLITGQIREGNVANVGAILTFHDTTAERDLEKMKLDFVSMAAHELRTPLTTIQGYLSFLRDDPSYKKLDQNQQSFLTQITNSTTRLMQLIENLLIVSRIEKGETALHATPLDLSKVVLKICDDLKGLADVKQLKLTFERPKEPLPLVAADQLRISEVLTNLIGNAIAYTQQGEVTVTLTDDVDQVVCAIKDTGPGIPHDALPHLFTKFFRVQGELEAGSKGTGLGLYISKQIIDSHKGKIWVESDIGYGSTFYFSLPTAETGVS